MRILFCVGIAFLREFNRLEKDEFQQNEQNLPFLVTNTFTSVTCGIGQLIGFSFILSFVGIVYSEFKSLAVDFKSDSNTYQLAVVTHYTFAYKNLLQLYQCIRSCLRWVQLLLAFKRQNFCVSEIMMHMDNLVYG